MNALADNGVIALRLVVVGKHVVDKILDVNQKLWLSDEFFNMTVFQLRCK